jgi:hypothetical protein
MQHVRPWLALYNLQRCNWTMPMRPFRDSAARAAPVDVLDRANTYISFFVNLWFEFQHRRTGQAVKISEGRRAPCRFGVLSWPHQHLFGENHGRYSVDAPSLHEIAVASWVRPMFHHISRYLLLRVWLPSATSHGFLAFWGAYLKLLQFCDANCLET